jgi:hypothetical protein
VNFLGCMKIGGNELAKFSSLTPQAMNAQFVERLEQDGPSAGHFRKR